MAQSRTPAALLPHLTPLLLAVAATAAQRRTGERFLTLTLGLVQTLGRHTMTGILRSLGRAHLDWSAAYRLFSRSRIDLAVARRTLLHGVLATLAPGSPLVVVLDATHLPRTSARMPGVGWSRCPATPVWRPGIARAQRFVGLSALLPRSPHGHSRAVPLRFLPAPTPTARAWPEHPPRREWEAGHDALSWLRDELAAAEPTPRPVLALADGSYAVAPLLAALPSGVNLLARCARNRALYALPAPRLPGTRGRHRRYGERAPTPTAQLQDRAGWRRIPTPVRGRTLHLRVRVTGPWLIKPASQQPVFLLLVRGIGRAAQGRRGQRDPAFLLVSAVADGAGGWRLPLPVGELVAWAWQRWEVEVFHREVKSGLGLGEQQAWSPAAAAAVIAWVVWVYGALVLAAYRAWGWEHAPPRARWQRPRRWTARDAAAALRAEVWDDAGQPFPPGWVQIRGSPPEMTLTAWPMGAASRAASRL